MQFTGHNDFGKHQARNFGLERLTVLPAFLSEDFGRLIYVETAGLDFGAWVGGVSSWQRFESLYLSPVLYTFTRDGGMGQGSVDLGTYLPGRRLVAIMPRPGFLIGAVLQSSEDTTAGRLDSKIQKNGTDLVPTGLDLFLDDSTHIAEHYGIVAPGTLDYAFAAGDKFSVDLDTDVLWATASLVEFISQELHVVFTPQ